MATRTASQRRADAQAAYDVFMAGCPSRQVIDTLSDKWVCLLICALRDGSMRYSELRTTIAGVSQKMLTQTLRTLEREGLVSRTVTPSVPVRVDYELTALGETIVPVIEGVKKWAESHIAQIEAARASYDGRDRNDAQPA